MSMESAKAFMDRMKTDKELAKKTIAWKDWETALPLITKEGFDFTPEEFERCQNEKLTDAELDAVAGGTGWKCLFNTSW
ncbi:MAG TPA: Nif11-like leader peptide family natural product precursor [Negativicutes bacterium]|nr:Nif11-like leader peptide family natural product precursor [Negativicutes bacterium]